MFAAATLPVCKSSSASLTINLSFPNGSTIYDLSPSDVGTTIPINVWGTITTAIPVTPGNDGPTGNHDGMSWVFYNVLSSVPNGPGTQVGGQITSAVLDTALGNANGFGTADGGAAQPGVLEDANHDGVTDLGPDNSTPVSALAEPHCTGDFWDDSQNTFPLLNVPQIVVSNNDLSVSFLLETLNFQVTSLGGQETVFSLQNPNLAGVTVPAEWYEDDPTEPFGTGVGAAYTKSSSPLDGTSVTFLAPTSVPEPASISLLVIAGIGFLGRRRKIRVDPISQHRFPAAPGE